MRARTQTVAEDGSLLLTCTKCGLTKSMDGFRKNARLKFGREPQCKACQKARELEYREREPDAMAQYRLKYRWKLTPEGLVAMLEGQDGKCAICRADIRDRFDVDHDHECCARHDFSCGECVRGLLCHRCNSGLRERAFHAAALAYIDAHRAKAEKSFVPI